MRQQSSDEVTALLRRIAAGDRAAESDLLEILYPRLKRIAATYLRRERKNHTLQPTAVVHEAYIRLFGESEPLFESRAHFFAVAAKAMRNVLIDHARKVNSAKRGRDFDKISLEPQNVVDPNALSLEDLLTVASLMDRLEAVDEVAHRVALLRHYLGMTEDEIAKELDMSGRTVRRRWQYGRAFLHKELKQTGGPRVAAAG